MLGGAAASEHGNTSRLHPVFGVEVVPDVVVVVLGAFVVVVGVVVVV